MMSPSIKQTPASYKRLPVSDEATHLLPGSRVASVFMFKSRTFSAAWRNNGYALVSSVEDSAGPVIRWRN